MRVYYTGDMANAPGWFHPVGDMDDPSAHINLYEDGGEGRKFLQVRRSRIGDEYKGHCNPRFVTEEAYEAYYAQRRNG